MPSMKQALVAAAAVLIPCSYCMRQNIANLQYTIDNNNTNVAEGTDIQSFKDLGSGSWVGENASESPRAFSPHSSVHENKSLATGVMTASGGDKHHRDIHAVDQVSAGGRLEEDRWMTAPTVSLVGETPAASHGREHPAGSVVANESGSVLSELTVSKKDSSATSLSAQYVKEYTLSLPNGGLGESYSIKAILFGSIAGLCLCLCCCCFVLVPFLANSPTDQDTSTRKDRSPRPSKPSRLSFSRSPRRPSHSSEIAVGSNVGGDQNDGTEGEDAGRLFGAETSFYYPKEKVEEAPAEDVDAETEKNTLKEIKKLCKQIEGPIQKHPSTGKGVGSVFFKPQDRYILVVPDCELYAAEFMQYKGGSLSWWETGHAYRSGSSSPKGTIPLMKITKVITYKEDRTGKTVVVKHKLHQDTHELLLVFPTSRDADEWSCALYKLICLVRGQNVETPR